MSAPSQLAPRAQGPMPCADWALALTLAALTVATRWPYRARLLPTWDAVQFALALERYDVVRHQTHPPGYILYVALGRLADATSIDFVYRVCAFLPLLGLLTVFLPDLGREQRTRRPSPVTGSTATSGAVASRSLRPSALSPVRMSKR